MSLTAKINTAFAEVGTDVNGILAKTNNITITGPVDLDDIATRVASLDQAVVLKGNFNPSGGVFPGGGSAQAGETWIATASATIDSVEINANDRVIALVDNARTGVAADWHIASYTNEVVSVNGRVGAVTGLQEAADIGDTNTDFLLTYTNALDT